MSGHSDASQIRLASANRRISAFLAQIAELNASSFPHQDGKLALSIIDAACREARDRLEIPSSANKDLIDQTCVHVADLLSNYTSILGFILRSTNVRNPFELHFALKKLVGRVINSDAKLLISSEWDFVPFTYPIGLDFLPDFVLVGSPAPESGNVLLSPLAGHEIGHSAWRGYSMYVFLTPHVTKEVDRALNENAGVSSRLVTAQGLGALGRVAVADRCADHAMRQLEELFSDIFGLYVFGSAYLFAYDYFLAPGCELRSLDYPSDAYRMATLFNVATILKITTEPLLAKHWIPARPDVADSDILAIVDTVTDAVAPLMRDRIVDELRQRGISPPNDENTHKILRAFKRNEPFSERAMLAEIVTAGWFYIQEKGGLYRDEDRDEYTVLGDLMLKSIEVSEYLERLSPDA